MVHSHLVTMTQIFYAVSVISYVSIWVEWLPKELFTKDDRKSDMSMLSRANGPIHGKKCSKYPLVPVGRKKIPQI